MRYYKQQWYASFLLPTVLLYERTKRSFAAVNLKLSNWLRLFFESNCFLRCHSRQMNHTLGGGIIWSYTISMTTTKNDRTKLSLKIYICWTNLSTQSKKKIGRKKKISNRIIALRNGKFASECVNLARGKSRKEHKKAIAA